MNERFPLEHNHATTFSHGHVDWYRDCPVCDLGQEIFRDAAKVRYDYAGQGTKWGEVTMPYSLVELAAEDVTFTTTASGLSDVWVRE